MDVPPGNLPPPGGQPPPLPPPARPATWGGGAGVGLCLLVGLVVFLNLMSWKIAFVIGLALVATGGELARRQHAWLKSAQVVRGVVIKIEETWGRKSTTYRPRLRYTTRAGEDREFVAAGGSNQPEFRVGDSVLVAYDANRPADQRLATFGACYGLASFVVALGVGLALWSAMMVAGRIAMPRVYAPDQAAFLAP